MNLSDPITPHYIAHRKQEILAKFHASSQGSKMEVSQLQAQHGQVSKRQSQLLKLLTATQREISKYFQTFQPLPCNPATFADLRLYGGPRIAINQGKLYIGTIVDGKRHGKGLIVSQRGKIYEGELLLNERNGVGVEIYENSNFYVGGFAASRREGTGKMVWANKTAQGTTYQYYVGSWKEGEPHGSGLHSTETWNFVGSFKQGMRCGKGIQVRPGLVFQGNFLQNAREGKGVLIEEGVEYYQGEFKAGRKHGYGRWKCLRTGEDYQGFFQDNRKEGIGVSHKDGVLYRGLFTEDKPNGTGEYTHPGKPPKQDLRVVTDLQIKPKSKQRPRGELQSAQFVRSNPPPPRPSLKTQNSTKSMHKIVQPPRMAKLNTSRDNQAEKNSKEKSKQKEKVLQRRFSLASAKLVRTVDNPQKHACSYKHCSCHQWQQNSNQKLKIDENRILRLFSARKTLLKSIV